ncbi:MAG TPA: class I SAM-dependent methyltransferase [Mycobacteriales bacterium]|nr:class I SAM-dependent methyltransferase [Mycobacteriales bacterium]
MCEDLQALTLADSSVDVFVTQDVFEHIPDPEAAWREIARVLAPGGVHVWTVPIFAGRATLQRARPDGHGGVELLLEADFHGNPIGNGASLVIHEWGEDVVSRADRAGGTVTERFNTASRLRGVRGEMLDVLVTRRGPR